MRWLVVFAGGCNALFGIHELAPPDGVDTSSCAQVMLADDFSETAPCDPWGVTYGTVNGGVVTEGSGMLSMSPASQAGAAVGCSSTAHFALGSGGVAVAITQVLRGSAAYTGLQFESDGPGFAIGIADGNLLFSDIQVIDVFGSVLFDPHQPFVRLRADNDATIVGERSADGATWSPIASAPSGGAGSGQIVLDASLAASTTFQGPAQFAQLLVCAP